MAYIGKAGDRTRRVEVLNTHFAGFRRKNNEKTTFKKKKKKNFFNKKPKNSNFGFKILNP